ncbi:hypothetical protein E2542_SST12998 [Spatholobus suberectus]|nr:hypothetical protein E2542_SST12998 [Spatholobus suberectus]
MPIPLSLTKSLKSTRSSAANRLEYATQLIRDREFGYDYLFYCCFGAILGPFFAAAMFEILKNYVTHLDGYCTVMV